MPDDVQAQDAKTSAPAAAAGGKYTAPDTSMGDAPIDGSGPDSPTAAETPTPDDPYANVHELDHEELIKRHPKLRDTFEGFRGRLAQSRADRDRLRAEVRAEIERENEESHLRELRKTDPYRYVEEVETRERAEELSRGQQTHITTVVNDFDGLLRNQLGRLPEESRRALAQKDYGADLTAREAFLEDVFKAYGEHVLAEARASWNKEDRAALETEVRGEAALRINLDTGAGTPPGARVVTDEDVARMDLTEYEKYFDERGEPKDGVVYRPTAAAGARRR